LFANDMDERRVLQWKYEVTILYRKPPYVRALD